MRILAIIPAYNEQDCLEQTIRSLESMCPSIDYIIVNDGSTDDTKQICERNHFSHVNLPVNSGLSVGFQTGMKYADRHGYDAAVQFDADGQHLPEYIIPMGNALEEQQADIVIASRTLAGEAPAGARGAGSKIISALIRLTSGVRLTDPTSGMRMYSRRMIGEFAKGYDLTPEPDTVALLARKGCKVIEVPARMQERQGGESYFDFTHVIAYMSRVCFSILLFQWFR